MALLLGLGALLAGACAHGLNYDHPAGPRLTGGAVPQRAPRRALRVVSFNVAYARALDRVAAVLQQEPRLRDADLILLQEMDSASTERLAAALHRAYVYVPATWHPVSGRDFGTAILSAWPVVETRKVLLPHLGLWRRTRRAAAAATVCVGARPVQVYAVHLGTPVEISPAARREQLDAVLADAEGFDAVIVGGDLNSESVAEAAVARGYAWPTRRRGATKSFWEVDHVIVRGLPALEAGVVRIPPDASDHYPVWVTVGLDGGRGKARCAAP